MGYDIHITKKPHWFDEGPDIPEADWTTYIASDPELRLTGAAEVTLSDGSIFRHESPFLAEWTGHPSGEVVWFDFRDHRVVVKNPDEETIQKMQSVATKLNARVQGDDGEFYDP